MKAPQVQQECYLGNTIIQRGKRRGYMVYVCREITPLRGRKHCHGEIRRSVQPYGLVYYDSRRVNGRSQCGDYELESKWARQEYKDFEGEETAPG